MVVAGWIHAVHVLRALRLHDVCIGIKTIKWTILELSFISSSTSQDKQPMYSKG